MSVTLSICIPTLNRAALLEDMLYQLSQLTDAFTDRLEIVVADNASEDHTRQVVENSPLQIRYGRQATTVGFTKNVLFATTELATGDYVWLVGDDDLILPDALTEIFTSLDKAPDVDYHYLNFGWVNGSKRHELIHEHGGLPDASLLSKLQFSQCGWHRLDRIEELTALPSDNVSAAFSGIFCFIARRRLFIEGKPLLSPSDSLDGSSTNMSDCFPHAMLTLPAMADKPVAFIGTPCLMQGINAWEWGAYAYKNMIFGSYQLFQWLERTAFGQDAMERLWQSYYQMAGRLFFRMQYSPDEHKGFDIVSEEAIPFCSKQEVFWQSFMTESRLFYQTELEASQLAGLVREKLSNQPELKLGLWGISGRGHRLVKDHPDISKNLVWITDKDTNLHDVQLDGTALSISPPHTITHNAFDILIIATRKDFVNDVISYARPQLSPDTLFVSTEGYAVNGSGSNANSP